MSILSLVSRPLHHFAKKNGLVHKVQILGSVPRNEEWPTPYLLLAMIVIYMQLHDFNYLQYNICIVVHYYALGNFNSVSEH